MLATIHITTNYYLILFFFVIPWYVEAKPTIHFSEFMFLIYSNVSVEKSKYLEAEIEKLIHLLSAIQNIK